MTCGAKGPNRSSTSRRSSNSAMSIFKEFPLGSVLRQMSEYDLRPIGRPARKTRKAVVGQLRQPRTIDVDYVQIRHRGCPEAENDALAVGRNVGQQTFKVIGRQVGDLYLVRAIWIHGEQLKTASRAVPILEDNLPTLSGSACCNSKHDRQ